MRLPRVVLAITRSKSRTEFRLDLTQNGFDVVVADNGLECLQILRTFLPDLLVIEPELRWGGGDGVLDVIRDDPTLCNIPVLALTTTCNRTAIYSISQFSISDFWVQPIAPSQLTERVLLLTGRESWSPPYEAALPVSLGASASRAPSSDEHQFLPVADTS